MNNDTEKNCAGKNTASRDSIISTLLIWLLSMCICMGTLWYVLTRIVSSVEESKRKNDEAAMIQSAAHQKKVAVKPVEKAIPAAPVLPAAPAKKAAPAAPVKKAAPAAPVKKAVPAAPVKKAVPAAPVKKAAPVAPVKKAAPEVSLKKEDLEKRFWSIIAKLPLKIELFHATVAPEMLRNNRGNALAMKFNRIRKSASSNPGSEAFTVYQVPYKINIFSFFRTVYNQKPPLHICPVIRKKIVALDNGKYILSKVDEQIPEIYKMAFPEGASLQNIAEKLDKLEMNIGRFNIPRYTVSVHLSSYSEEHKLISQTENKIQFEIHSAMLAEVTIRDNVSKALRTFKHTLTTRTPGDMTFSNPRQSTAAIRWNRTPVFELSAEKLAELLKKDLNPAQP